MRGWVARSLFPEISGIVLAAWLLLVVGAGRTAEPALLVSARAGSDRALRASASGHLFEVSPRLATPGRESPAETYSLQVYRLAVGRRPELVAGLVRPRDGTVQACWVADPDGDRQPEVLVWVAVPGSRARGLLEVFAFDGQRLVERPLPDLTPEEAMAYGGRDRYYVTPQRVVRKFELLREEDVDTQPTGGRRVIVYELRQGRWQVVAAKSTPAAELPEGADADGEP